mgnify:FL=1
MRTLSNSLDNFRKQEEQYLLQTLVCLCRSYDEYRYASCIFLLSLLFINAVALVPVGPTRSDKGHGPELWDYS